MVRNVHFAPQDYIQRQELLNVQSVWQEHIPFEAHHRVFLVLVDFILALDLQTALLA
jgi:hypothetical protein